MYDMMQLPPTVVAQDFVGKVSDLSTRAKTAAEVQGWVRDKIRERSVGRKIMTPRPIALEDCTVSLHHDQLIRIEALEPMSRAMSFSFRSEPRARYAYASRFAVGFYKIGSERVEKSEEDLMVYAKTGLPIYQLIEKHAVTDIEEIEDWYWVLFSEAAAQANQTALAVGGATVGLSVRNIKAGTVTEVSIAKGTVAMELDSTDDADIGYTVYPLQKNDFTRLGQLFVGEDDARLQLDTVMMTEHDALQMQNWTDRQLGQKVGDVAIGGFTYDTVGGWKYVRTLKTSVLRIGNVYGYTKPEFLGFWYILREPRFYLDKEVDFIRWESWLLEGVGFGNIASVRKIELYPGSVTPGLESNAVLARTRRPRPQAQLGTENNRVALGQWTPVVNTF